MDDLRMMTPEQMRRIKPFWPRRSRFRARMIENFHPANLLVACGSRSSSTLLRFGEQFS